jgi:predicted TIM-barrel fold metal-dependent hydrolase
VATRSAHAIDDVVDCQWHWYPRTFFEQLVGRRTFPRCEHDAREDLYRLEVAADEFLPFPRAIIDRDAMLENLSASGISTAVVSAGSISVDAFEPAVARELCDVLNQEMAAAQRDYPDCIIGTATLPLQNGEAARQVLEEAVADLGLRAVWLPSNVAGEPLVSDRTRQLFAALEEQGVVGLLHPIRSVMADKLERFGLEYVAGYILDTSLAVLSIVLSGIMEKHPGLRFVHPHLGGVLPYIAGRVDREYIQPWAGNTRLPRPPSAYLRRFYTDTVSDSPAALRYALEFYGADHVLFGSDHPWWPVADGLDLVKRHLDENTASAVLSENARKLFGAQVAPGGASVAD